MDPSREERVSLAEILELVIDGASKKSSFASISFLCSSAEVPFFGSRPHSGYLLQRLGKAERIPLLLGITQKKG